MEHDINTQHSFSKIGTDQEREYDIANKIQSRIEAGSQLLFFGGNDTFSEKLKSLGVIHSGDQGNLCYFPEDDRKFCCLWLPEGPHDVKKIGYLQSRVGIEQFCR
ncbi:hypothetical protein B1757_13055 [Acidithiobacillus marinus]|uniref:Uncharacterized protein n=1 Tax=Acidithiobacillus marinus TaxID=187490 RepID=A0A2I1DIV8_9PROT|nr:hypothetical protein [Acidithiobacillus marinus]PKY09810.1 hypothetical protein B1757_13055 [Acidithiobacillus marinus]